MQAEQIRRMLSRVRALFGHALVYTVAVPSYYGGAMTFVCATDAPQEFAVAESALAMRLAASRIRTRCYTPAFHVAAFALPRYLAEPIRGGGKRSGGSTSPEGSRRW